MRSLSTLEKWAIRAERSLLVCTLPYVADVPNRRGCCGASSRSYGVDRTDDRYARDNFERASSHLPFLLRARRGRSLDAVSGWDLGCVRVRNFDAPLDDSRTIGSSSRYFL